MICRIACCKIATDSRFLPVTRLPACTQVNLVAFTSLGLSYLAGLLVSKKVTAMREVAYWAAQVIGSVTGSALAFVVSPLPLPRHADAGCEASIPQRLRILLSRMSFSAISAISID